MGTLHLYIMWIRHIRLYMYVYSAQSYNFWIRCLAIVRTYTDESQRATLELPLWEKAKGVGIVLFGDLSLFDFRSLDLFWVLFSQGLFFWILSLWFFSVFPLGFSFSRLGEEGWPFGESAPLGLSFWLGCILFSFFFSFWICSVVSLFFPFVDSRSALDFFFFPSKGLCSAIVGKVLKGESCSWSLLLLLLVVCAWFGGRTQIWVFYFLRFGNSLAFSQLIGRSSCC